MEQVFLTLNFIFNKKPLTPLELRGQNFFTMQKIASSGTIEGLQMLLNEFYCSTSWRIANDLTITNVLGKSADKLTVKKQRGRYILYFI